MMSTPNGQYTSEWSITTFTVSSNLFRICRFKSQPIAPRVLAIPLELQ